GLGRIGAGAGGGVAGARVVALVRRGAEHGVRPRTRPGLAGVAAGARVGVVAFGAVGLRGIGAGTGCRVARAGVVALVLGGAADGARLRAGAGLAGVAAGARVRDVAVRVVGLGGIGAGAGRGVALTGVVALVRRRAHDRRAGGARAALAGITDRARIAIVTRAAVRPGGIRALAGRRVAGARVVALVLRGADDGVRPGAGPGLAGVAAGARVVVVAAGRVRRVDAAGHGGAGIVRARVAGVAVRRW